MDEFLKRLLADGIVATDDEIDAHRAEILGRARDFVTKMGATLKANIDATIATDDFGFFGNAVKPALTKALDNLIDKKVNDFVDSENVWLTKIIDSAKQYATQIGDAAAAAVPTPT
jgi:hypothetical protein